MTRRRVWTIVAVSLVGGVLGVLVSRSAPPPLWTFGPFAALFCVVTLLFAVLREVIASQQEIVRVQEVMSTTLHAIVTGNMPVTLLIKTERGDPPPKFAMFKEPRVQ